MNFHLFPPNLRKRDNILPSLWDILAFFLVVAAITLIIQMGSNFMAPLSSLQQKPISLDPAALPYYAMRTTFRMLAGLALSLIFTFVYASIAARSVRWERILIPLLDILQSIPILGFLSATIAFFLALAPGRILGAEFAAIFAIFTSQAWNMTFSLYQSIRTVPEDLRRAARSYHFSRWMTFWRVHLPFGIPALIWNMMISVSGGWFFVVASEAIAVGHTRIALPGVGSYIATAIAQRDLQAIGYAIGCMVVVILLYDQFFFRPLIAWAARFGSDSERYDNEHSRPKSWFLTVILSTRYFKLLYSPFVWLISASINKFQHAKTNHSSRHTPSLSKHTERLADWLTALALIGLFIVLVWNIRKFFTWEELQVEIPKTALYAAFTTIRVFILISIASLIWVPVGVWIGLRPKLARIVTPIIQFLAAFPNNLFFPLVVVLIAQWQLNENIWLSPLMILGTQWYILFNVIAGTDRLPQDLQDISRTYHIGGLLWWKRFILPGIFPYYLTGVINTSAGAWNASIISEYAQWGDMVLQADGLGAYIQAATNAGEFKKIAIGIAMMSLFIIIINRLFWSPLYDYAEKRFRML